MCLADVFKESPEFILDFYLVLILNIFLCVYFLGNLHDLLFLNIWVKHLFMLKSIACSNNELKALYIHTDGLFTCCSVSVLFASEHTIRDTKRS